MNQLSNDELRRHITRSNDTADKGQSEEICGACGSPWIPDSWNFYGLCTSCFAEFNDQKMRGRFSTLPGGTPLPYYESSEKWIEQVKNKGNDRTHQDPPL